MVEIPVWLVALGVISAILLVVVLIGIGIFAYVFSNVLRR